VPNQLGERETLAIITARTLLDRASLAVDGSDPGAMIAVVLSDLAVETAAKAALIGRPRTAKSRDLNFQDLMTALLAVLPAAQGGASDPPEVTEVRWLRDLRNLVQHDAQVPSAGEVGRALIRAEDFLRWLTQSVYGVPLEAISRSQLVRDERTREHLVAAETNIEHGDYAEAASRLALAFEYACLSYRALEAEEDLGPDTTLRRWPFDVRGMVADIKAGDPQPAGGRRYRNLERGFRSFAQMLDSLWERVEALSLGADAAEHGWFRRTFPPVHGWVEPGLVSAPVDRDYSREEVVRGYDFVMRTILRWQQFPARPRAQDESEVV
jgi:hypothetical protein